MGVLRRSDGQAPFELSAVTRVGRDADNELIIDDVSVSHFHAVIRWTSLGEWEIRDLGSTNGTFLNGKRLKGGDRHSLHDGARLRFGNGEQAWVIEDVSRPLPEARSLLSGERVFGTVHLLSLEGGDGEIVDVLEEHHGNWVMELDGNVTDVRSGQIVVVAGIAYRLGLPLPSPETETTRMSSPSASREPLGGATLGFFLSVDLESVAMRVEWSNKRWESHKAYNRALLALAQARLRDHARGVQPHEQGWVYGDELCTLADYDGIGRLNVELHRVRADLAKQGVPNAPSIVQRRRATGQLRIGTHYLRVVEKPGD